MTLTGAGPRLDGPTMAPHSLRRIVGMECAVVFEAAATEECTVGVQGVVTGRPRFNPFIRCLNLGVVIQIGKGGILYFGNLQK